ncbi:hypothetical protein P152DRAFT_255970 [Eremomyces bilateralis CBS 781.70]|uniref:Uncharacterized protein n=1 Tax=Eremomyces bilateralis CBS 781.70 TaxID=1392243 RepID=A0A6G1FQV3_9PEZI|nr:uncharacterized protein P152DRAFT_255970 [Eremomyces bilateralis CBS 781.70]KAF1808126.1 hypothetical protein P152DRAFT_255970 [Eremomyces bilateralis CBS 781.70]
MQKATEKASHRTVFISVFVDNLRVGKRSKKPTRSTFQKQRPMRLSEKGMSSRSTNNNSIPEIAEDCNKQRQRPAGGVSACCVVVPYGDFLFDFDFALTPGGNNGRNYIQRVTLASGSCVRPLVRFEKA